MKKIIINKKMKSQMIYLYDIRKKSLSHISKKTGLMIWVVVNRLRDWEIRIRGRREYLIGKKQSKETRMKIRRSKLGVNNPMWKDKITYRALHSWIIRNKEPKEFCKTCKKHTKKLEIANISGKYKRDINDFEWLCIKCHKKKDSERRWFNEKTKEKGIVLRNKRWVAQIRFRNKQKWLGTFDTKDEAINARKKEIDKIRTILLSERIKLIKITMRKIKKGDINND